MLHLYFVLTVLQTPAPAVATPAAAEVPATPGPITNPVPNEVRDLLAKVAAAQWKQKPGPPLRAFAMRLNLRDRSGDTPREIEAKIRFRSEKGGLIRLNLHDPDRGLRISKGFDGTKYWLAEDNQPLVDLGGREFSQDRKSIDQALAMCEDLLLLLDPHQIPEVATKVSLLEPIKQNGFSAHLIKNGNPWEFQVLLSKNYLPESLAMIPLWKDKDGKAPKARHFQMSYYKEFQGRRLPQVIEEALGENQKLPARIYELREFFWKNPTLIQVDPPPVLSEKDTTTQ
jgi:hypothetical protein